MSNQLARLKFRTTLPRPCEVARARTISIMGFLQWFKAAKSFSYDGQMCE